MLLDASGNLGLGVTPSAWSGFTAMQVQTLGIWSAANDNYANFSSNSYFDGSNNRYISTQAATLYQQYRGNHYWFNAPSGTAGNAISFTQAMTLNASGNLSIGNTNDTYKLDVSGTGRFTGTLTAATLTDGFITIGAAQINRTSATVEMQFSGSGDVRFFGNGSYPITFTASTGAATFSSSVTATQGIIRGDLGTSVEASLRLRGSNSTARTTRLQFEDYAGAYADGLIDFKIPTAGSAVGARLDIGVDGAIMSLVRGGNVGIGTTTPGSKLSIVGLPTSSSGLSSGDIWNDGGTLKIV
jgi:hypothetical protein